MDSRKIVWKETAVIAVGQVLCVAVMIGLFAMFGYYDRTVLFGGIFGGVLATANFFFMAVGTSLAADKAEAQNVKGGKAIIQMSFLIRQVLLIVFLLAGVKSGKCNLIALLLPLVFTRPILMIGEFFRKSGDKEV